MENDVRDSRNADRPHTGQFLHFREGDRVFCDVAESEGLVLRNEDWGDLTVPVMLDEPEGLVIKAPVHTLMKV